MGHAPIKWTAEKDRVIREKHAAGWSHGKIAELIGCGRSAVGERVRRLRCSGPVRDEPRQRVRDLHGPLPLPPGHPLSWGLVAPGVPFPR